MESDSADEGVLANPEPSQPITEPAPAEIVPDAPLLTVEKFVRTLRDRMLGNAFIHVEKLRPEGVRRLPLVTWQAEYDAFLKAPRG